MCGVKRSEERTVYYCIVVKMGRGWGSGTRGTRTVPPTMHHNTHNVRFVKNPGGGGHGHVQKSLAEIHPPDPKVGHDEVEGPMHGRREVVGESREDPGECARLPQLDQNLRLRCDYVMITLWKTQQRIGK